MNEMMMMTPIAMTMLDCSFEMLSEGTLYAHDLGQVALRMIDGLHMRQAVIS